MTHRALKLAAALAAFASALLLGCEPPSRTVKVDFTVDVSGVARPASSGVAIVGNSPSLGATVDKPGGDPTRGLNLRLQPDGTYRASAWITKPEDPAAHVTYVVYMTNPFAPEIEAAGGPPKTHDVSFDSTTGEQVAVTLFDVPQNIVKPCVDFTVTVPTDTPPDDPVYMAGDDDQLGPWAPGKYAMTNNNDGTYSTHICFNQGQVLQYKYVRSNGDWSKVEKNADGTERANRVITVTEDVSHSDTVVKWADLP